MPRSRSPTMRCIRLVIVTSPAVQYYTSTCTIVYVHVRALSLWIYVYGRCHSKIRSGPIPIRGDPICADSESASIESIRPRMVSASGSDPSPRIRSSGLDQEYNSPELWTFDYDYIRLPPRWHLASDAAQ